MNEREILLQRSDESAAVEQRVHGEPHERGPLLRTGLLALRVEVGAEHQFFFLVN